MSVKNTEIADLPTCTVNTIGDEKRLYLRFHKEGGETYQLVLTGKDAEQYHAFLVKADG